MSNSAYRQTRVGEPAVFASENARRKVMAHARTWIANAPEWKRAAYAAEAAEYEEMARVARNGG